MTVMQIVVLAWIAILIFLAYSKGRTDGINSIKNNEF